jgi:hypothetical protein
MFSVPLQTSFATKAAVAATAVAVVGTGGYFAIPSVHASGAADGLHPPSYPWDVKSWNKTFDKARYDARSTSSIQQRPSFNIALENDRHPGQSV